MYLETYEFYKENYVNDAKIIKYQTYSLELTNGKSSIISFKNVYKNFELYFDMKGKLLQSIDYRGKEGKKYKSSYFYDSNDILVKHVEIIVDTNKISETTDYSYDSNNRLKNYITIQSEVNYKRTIKSKYNYKDNTVKNRIEDSDNKDIIVFTEIKDSKSNIIEEKVKRNNEELIIWEKNQYDDNNVLIKTISFDENENINGLFEYIRTEDNMNYIEKYTSEELNFEKEYVFELNERKDWVNQIVLLDKEIQFVIERKIDYYF